MLLQGNEAVALGALKAGVRFYAGYPISPSSEIAEALAKLLPAHGGVFIQMEDEIAGAAAVLGASLAGVKAITATSGPGFSLMQESIGFGAMAEIPCVIVDVQRAGPSTGLPTHPAQGDVMQARWGTHGDHPIIVLCPSSVLEAYWLTIQAVNFSEKFRTPVILLMDEVTGHMREKVILPPDDRLEIVERKRPTCSPQEYQPYLPEEDGVPPMAPFGAGYRYHVTGLFHDETGFPSTKPAVVDRLLRRLHRKIDQSREEITLTKGFCTDDCEILVVSYGISSRSAYRAVKEARRQGMKAGLLTLQTLWPFPEEALRRAARQASRVMVPELNLGQLRLEVERVLAGSARVEGLTKVNGEIFAPEEILAGLGGI
ncbi:MAG TPA: 2-oxoacid:acceptor oxidoreductase subunit alpha [Clostridia bacterium]|nr:2-oxoacid:acceptor oxidoreductase subunit alpha [Clostridia bacterium]